LTPVAPQDIAAHWPRVESGLLQVTRRTRERWTPTHVLQALHEGVAELFVCDDGFAVLQRLKEGWTSEPFINVWAMWFAPGKGRLARPEVEAWLTELATKSCGNPKALKFSSPRIGWKALEPEWEIERIIWRRKK
jgi:hypothetical protein